ncbi:hypothetical protein H4217_002234 [Coemansia sp. RSA 1939]|nr:hypothetical protein H4217_002234 [Coemansia sp. RSA 1939]KAJ2614528.1 hypothetical protein EV177_002016 [Coemansia sp. RSA 1804]
MYANSRKASRETCASSPSPASSPTTPGIDSNPAEPLFAEYSSQSATLDSIGAWSSVQTIPASHASSAMGAYKSPVDICDLRGKYSTMNLDHKPPLPAVSYSDANTTMAVSGNNSNGPVADTTRVNPDSVAGIGIGRGGGHSTVEVDYSELDEAILRGRSTTLPNIFAMPNPIYRFSTVASVEPSGSPGHISPASSATLGVISRHGSISISNSNRTVSPLGASISSNPIHRTTSLDNPIASQMDPIYTAATATITGSTARYDAVGAASNASGLPPKANPSISGSVSSTGTLVGISNASAIPIRRLPESSAETHHLLNLSAYSIGAAPNTSAGSGGGNSHHQAKSDGGVNSSGGASHGSVGRGAHASLSVSGIASSAPPSSHLAAQAHPVVGANPTSGSVNPPNEHPGDGSSAYPPPPGMHTRYAQLSHHLPTMCEEDVSSAALEPAAALADNALMRNMSMPSFGNSIMAAPLPQHFDSSTGLYALNRVSTASPLSVNRRTSVEHMTSFAIPDIAPETSLQSASAYAPHRINSLKDMRRPSLDIRSENPASDATLDGSTTASALFERSSGIRQSMNMNYLSGMSNLHRRHSLASASAAAAAAAGPSLGIVSTAEINAAPAQSAAGSFGPGDFGMYSHSNLQQNVYLQGAMFSAPYGVFGAHPVHIQRQQSMSVQPTMPDSHAQNQISSFQQYQGQPPTDRASASSSANGGPAFASHLSGMVPNAGGYPGSFVGPQQMGNVPQQQQHNAMGPLQPFTTMHTQQNTPPLLQPVPVPFAMQLAQGQASQQRPSRLQTQLQQHQNHLQQQQQQLLHQQQSSQQQSKQPLQTPQQQPQHHHHMRRASHPAIVGMTHPSASVALYPPMPILNGGSHTLLPNPATTITPNMPFADMGKGLPFQSLPKQTRVFVVQFKGSRCDLFFSPTKDMDVMVIPTLAPSAIPAPAVDAAGAQPSESQYAPGTYVLVEADRGVDLGIIKEELLSDAAVKSFSASLSDSVASSGSGFADAVHSDGRSSVAPTDSAASLVFGGSSDNDGYSSKPNSNSTGRSVSRKPSAKESLSAAATMPSAGSTKDVFIKRIFRVADQREVADLTNNKVLDEQSALTMCQGKVQQRKLSMCVVDAEFQFDRRKLTFYFKADRRVDFRELVRELFKHFKTRIWMCQQTS